MASYACNLSCKGCSNYSDLRLNGVVNWNECKSWLTNWLSVIDINEFSIIGGEPMINPYINDWLVGARELMPTTKIILTTNGLLLGKNFEVVETLNNIGNSLLKITVHIENNKIINDNIKKIFDLYEFEPTVEYGIQRFVNKNNFRIHIKKPTTFIKTFKNNYHNMMPHNNDPSEAFKICSQKTCPLLYKGRIYKCSSIAMLSEILVKFNRQEILEWQEYVNYKGIAFDDDINIIEKFVKMFGKPESICKMCPTENDTSSHIDHLKNVKRKNEKSP